MAFMELTETTEIASVWFGAWPTGDVLATVYRAAPGQPWVLMGRIRRRVDDEPHPLKSKDHKDGWSLTRDERPADDDARVHLQRQAREMIRLILAPVADAPPDLHVDRYEINGGVEKFLRVMQTWGIGTVHMLHPSPDRPQ